jgi:ring-1,2-phenylacetyl-CoA epoxidase subunit PaaD
MTEAGRQKLQVYGIAPPPPPGTGRGALFGNDAIACPKCGALDTERLAEFGSTSCKSLWRCRSCREPFDHFKCH